MIVLGRVLMCICSVSILSALLKYILSVVYSQFTIMVVLYIGRIIGEDTYVVSESRFVV
jgi:hypothetical protein